jgi:hypothetical protein
VCGRTQNTDTVVVGSNINGQDLMYRNRLVSARSKINSYHYFWPKGYARSIFGRPSHNQRYTPLFLLTMTRRGGAMVSVDQIAPQVHKLATEQPYVKYMTRGTRLRVEMATSKNPLDITCPNPYPRRKNMPAKNPYP